MYICHGIIEHSFSCIMGPLLKSEMGPGSVCQMGLLIPIRPWQCIQISFCTKKNLWVLVFQTTGGANLTAYPASYIATFVLVVSLKLANVNDNQFNVNLVVTISRNKMSTKVCMRY